MSAARRLRRVVAPTAPRDRADYAEWPREQDGHTYRALARTALRSGHAPLNNTYQFHLHVNVTQFNQLDKTYNTCNVRPPHLKQTNFTQLDHAKMYKLKKKW